MAGSARARVLLVDDHALFRQGLASLLRAAPDFEVVGEAADGLEAIAQAPVLQADVILMDVRMPRVNGLEATRQILRTLPQTKILMLSMSEDEDAVFEAVRNGAQGYLLKTADPEELFEALRGILRGEAHLSSGLAVKLLREFARQSHEPVAPAPPRTALSPREKEILALVADGQSNKEIATVLAVAENTVKHCIKKILEKLHLENRVQAAVFALSQDVPIIPSGAVPVVNGQNGQAKSR
jgi:two-component system nitrate/nitrite response regulator NarL